jgi:ADP-ribosylglycohydrolase
MVVDRQFFAHGHVVRLAVEVAASGWDIQETFDSAIVHVEHHSDWHRVERALWLLEIKARQSDLEQAVIAHS